MAVADYIYRILRNEGDVTDKTIKIDEASSIFAYLGIADDGSATSAASWKIARVFRQGNTYTIQYAEGGNYDQIWDNRTTLFPTGALANVYSINFDGVNDKVDFGNNYTFEHSQAFSISLWVKPNNLAATRNLFSKASDDANVYGYNLRHNITTGALFLQMRTPSSLRQHTFTTALTAGVWQHVVLTYSGGSNINGARVYRNAVIGDTPASGSLSGTFSNSASFVVGARNSSFNFSGRIDEVSVWNKALSQTEVDEIYNLGQPNDLSIHTAYVDTLSWWRADDDVHPTILDHKGSINGTMTNQSSADIVVDVP